MSSIRDLQRAVHENAVAHGFWEQPMDIGTAIALMHSELSEALEEERAGRPDVYCIEGMIGGDEGNCERENANKCLQCLSGNGNKPEGTLIELADCVIRIMDYCEARNWDLERAIKIKMDYNAGREYKHGKRF